LDENDKILISRRQNHNASLVDPDKKISEQNPKIICHVINKLLNEIKSEVVTGNEIAVAVCGQMHGFVAWDKNFEPMTNLVTWQGICL